MKNANGKGFDKDCRQSSSSQFKSENKGKNARDGGQYTVPTGPKCFRCQGFSHMKQEFPTYPKSIGKSKALAATLSDTKPDNDSMYRLASKKLTDVELEREKLSIKFDEANQTIGAPRFENNFLTENTKKLEAELFQVRAQLERTSSANLDEMLNFQKSASD